MARAMAPLIPRHALIGRFGRLTKQPSGDVVEQELFPLGGL